MEFKPKIIAKDIEEFNDIQSKLMLLPKSTYSQIETAEKSLLGIDCKLRYNYCTNMSIQLNRESYQKLIDEDIQALNSYMPEHSLERKHIVEVLKWSINQIYGTQRKVIAVISYDVQDFLNWRKENIDDSSISRDTQRRITVNNKIYYCISRPEHLCSLDIDEVIETESAKSNKHYDKIIEYIKPIIKSK